MPDAVTTPWPRDAIFELLAVGDVGEKDPDEGLAGPLLIEFLIEFTGTRVAVTAPSLLSSGEQGC